MTRIGWEKRANDLHQEVNLIKDSAVKTSIKFKELHRQVECCKVRFITHEFELKRLSLSRSRGVDAIVDNGKGLKAALGIGAAAFILTGIMSKDGLTAINGGLSGLKGALQGLGETDWAIGLEGQLAIVPRDNITAGHAWFKWESVIAGLNKLEQSAQNGAHLGNLDDIISRLLESGSLVAVSSISISRIKLINTTKKKV